MVCNTLGDVRHAALLASFPGSAQLSVFRFFILQATESWWGLGTKLLHYISFSGLIPHI